MVMAKSLHNHQSVLPKIWNKIRIILPKPSATARIWDFLYFTICQSKQLFLHSIDVLGFLIFHYL